MVGVEWGRREEGRGGRGEGREGREGRELEAVSIDEKMLHH